MSVARRPRVPRSFLIVLTAALAVLVVPGVATAEGPRIITDTVVGELVQAWPEHTDQDEAVARADDGPLSFIRTESGDSVRVETDDVRTLPLGATVEVTVGLSVSDEAYREDGYEKARDVVAAEVLSPAPEGTAPAVTPVNHEVSVVMAVPAGGVRDSTTLEQVVNTVDGPVADFWSAESIGFVNVGVTTVHDWVNLSVGCTDPFALWTAAARTVNFQSGPGKHLLVYVTSANTGLSGCSDGLGTVGTGVGSGGYSYVRGKLPSIVAHELGHNVGLGHSSALQCDGSIQGMPCATTPYRDLYDVMGGSWGQIGSLNVVQASRIYNVAPKVFEPRSTPGTVTLAPVSQRSGVRAIVLRDSAGTQYWLEFRPASGRDAWLGTSADRFGLPPGVLLRKASSGSDTSLLLDATPSGSARWADDGAAALPVGTPVQVMDTWVTGGGAFEVTVQSVTASAATVQVTPTTPIDVAHEAAGGDAGVLGPATSVETCVDRTFGGRYCQRAYQHGGIYWNLSTGAHLITEPVYAAYTAAGGATSNWGLPTTDTSCGRIESGCVQSFQHRIWATSPGTGAFAIQDRIAEIWQATGGEAGALGYPLGDRTCSAADSCRQPFQRGVSATSPTTGTHVVRNDLAAPWAALGHQTGRLGFPVTGLICGLKDGGCGQVFQGGRIYTVPGVGTHAVSGAVHAAWAAQGNELGELGYPSADQVCGLADVPCKQLFQGGTIYSHPDTGAHVVSGATAGAYSSVDAERGVLGYPRSGLICGLRSGGCGQVFQGGRIYTTVATGTHAVSGPMADVWSAQGFEQGALGYPTRDQECGLVTGVCTQRFQGGTVAWSATSGATSVTGAVATAWDVEGGVTGPLGPPATGLICGLKAGGCGQVFQGGRIYTTPGTGTHAASGAFAASWAAQRWEQGPLGYPLTGLICGLKDDGCGQVFQGGRIYTTAATGTHAVTGTLGTAWAQQGFERGPLGYPTGDQACGLAGGGCTQAFQGGVLTWSPATGIATVPRTTASAWTANGAEGGALGYPLTGLICGLEDGACGQVFQGGRIYTTPDNGTRAVSGAIADTWAQQGFERGALGYPTGDQVCGLAGGGCRQTFQKGTVYSHPSTGAHVVTGPTAATWAATGAEGGVLGYPLTGLICGLKDGGCGQVFQGGRIYTTPGNGTRAVSGAIAATWAQQGYERGTLGYPTSDAYPVTGGTAQKFQGGTLTLDAVTGTVARD